MVGRQRLGFFQMVTSAMVLLKLKDKYDEYNQVSDDEGRVALNSPYSDSGTTGGEGGIALLDTELPQPRKGSRKKGCRCCWLDCSIFWKAIGIVLGLFALYYAFKTVKWVLTDAPTGLEDMPIFSQSLGCLDAPHIYNGSQVSITAPVGTRLDHGFDIRGGAVGTITIADGAANATEVKYDFTLRSSDESALKDIVIDYPRANQDGTPAKSRLWIGTPHLVGACMRFDLTMYVPPNLKKLHVGSHATTQLQFAPGAKLDVEDLYVTLFTAESENMILPHKDVLAKVLSFEVYRGWIVGEASITRELSILTQRGDGIANIKAYAHPPSDPGSSDTISFKTATGAGRSNFAYVGSKGSKRQIDAMHTSSRNADVYLNYREAEYNGLIEMQSKSFTITGARGLPAKPDGGNGGGSRWTHFVGEKEGADRIYVSSRGWTGLYF